MSCFSDEIILMSATGTAAKVNLNLDQYPPMRQVPPVPTASSDRISMTTERDAGKKLYVDVNLANQVSSRLNLAGR